ncbi:FeoB-associated Cys-rich membrane protein [Mangrovibacterium sp.]|uniref:FeoB-associated Cys-rich membrane protein n=1 Tax=Mangrovibacterium sp. TaxID=1961364 RepID=UPI003566A775
MIQNIIVLIIVFAVVVKVGYNLYKALTTKEKGLCGGCASCDLKRELKKKGKLQPLNRAQLKTFKKEEIRFAGNHK